ncbi:tripartite tricarboxylate transporter TctB family protein [uncultured Jannaschia sp.]|uniref:tripartite tricarboxylate transporter TctB family protein n=1 Tax=uncultured Jannaschia sp. TaxID=293347 RepID=UPI002633A5B4|nr:tripartite tricarboxylate transporter TctB family protein [uncultured Jannaschia sp.]
MATSPAARCAEPKAPRAASYTTGWDTIFLLMLGTLVVVPWLGFTLTTFAFLSVSFLVLGVRPVSRALAVAGTGALTGWLFFIVLLDTNFPEGPFERLVQAVF